MTERSEQILENGNEPVNLNFDVHALPDCRCWFVDGQLCDDCQRVLIGIYRGDQYGPWVMVRAREVHRFQRMESNAIAMWNCTHKDEPCDCSVPLGWDVVGAQLERGEVQSSEEPMRHAG